MSHFYGEMKGNRGSVSRCGTKNSGMTCHIRGWDVGVRVTILYNDEEEVDQIAVYKTGGSNNPMNTKLIASVVEGY